MAVSDIFIVGMWAKQFYESETEFSVHTTEHPY